MEQRRNDEWRGDPDGEQDPGIFKISKEDDGPPVGAQAQQCTVNERARKMVDEYYPAPRGKGGVWEPAHDAPEGDTREHSSKKLQVWRGGCSEPQVKWPRENPKGLDSEGC